MIKLIALYKKPQDPAAFDKRYFEQHLAVASAMPGLRRMEVSKMVGAPAGDPEYYLVAELYFDNMHALQQAMTSPEGKAAAKDLMSFAKDIVSMMFAEIEEKIPVRAAQ